MVENRQSYILDIVVFVSGAVVMILELTGSRILAPYVGGSLPVWTGLIGIILGSLSLGYTLGGKAADTNPTYHGLMMILFQSGLALGLIPLLSSIFLPLIMTYSPDIRISTLLAAMLLFTLPSVLLGMVSPYAIRLKLESIKTSGTTAGRLYALSTVGSIMGTFFAGFFLISFLGSHMILYLLAASMIILSGSIMIRKWWKNVLFFSFLLSLCISGDLLYSHVTKRSLVEVDTQYSRVTIKEVKEPHTYRTIRSMIIGNELSSAMYLESDELVYDYTKYFRLIDHFVSKPQTALMLGGAGYSYPKDFIRTHPHGRIDIVEIDPALTELAKKYFAFQSNRQTTIYHEDARTFLNREEKKYDAILSDAFSSHYSHPFQLATKEAIEHMYDMLTPNGVVISNTVSSVTGKRGMFLRAQYYTYKSVFPYVEVFPVTFPSNGDVLQNTIIVAAKRPLNLSTTNKEFQEYLANHWEEEIPQDVPFLTDDFAPVEYYAAKIIE